MVDALKDIVGILDKLPQYTIWVLLGLLFYKIFIIGSWLTIARLCINKSFWAYQNPRPLPIQKVMINEKFVSYDNTWKEFLVLLDLILAQRNYLRRPVGGEPGNYKFDNHVHLEMDDVVWLKNATIYFTQKIEQEIKDKVAKGEPAVDMQKV